MSQITGMTPNNSAPSIATANKASDSFGKAASQALGKDAFLQLLVTQMKYQDPLQPMDNTQFVAQLAQFSSLEQMSNVANTDSSTLQEVQNLSQTTQMNTGFQLLGQNVAIQTGSQTFSGIVSSVKTDNGNVNLVIGNQQIPLSSIQSIQKG